MSETLAVTHDMTIVFHDTHGNGFVAECLELPGCLSQGETEAEAMANITDAIRDCLSVLFEDVLKETLAQRNLSEIIYTDISKQARIRMTPQISTEEAVA